MNIELQYKKALAQYNLSESKLPEDAQIGITIITDTLKAANMLEKRGKSITEKTIKKIKAMDKWIYYEILDTVNDTDNNDDEMPFDKKEVIKEIKEIENESKESEINNEDSKIVEMELFKLHESGKSVYTLNELKSSAKKTYDVVFDNYEEENENGLITSNFELIETDKQIFTLTKK
jgi:hypothetical protein